MAKYLVVDGFCLGATALGTVTKGGLAVNRVDVYPGDTVELNAIQAASHLAIGRIKPVGAVKEAEPESDEPEGEPGDEPEGDEPQRGPESVQKPKPRTHTR